MQFTSRHLNVASIAVLALSLAACSALKGAPTQDAGHTTDSGTTDAGMDATTAIDATTTTDAASADDGALSSLDSSTDTDAATGADGGIVCGGRHGMACGAGYFCQYSLGAICGWADGTGTCAPIPENCAKILEPVCGCDGMTYSNECAAAMASVSAASTGACPDAGVDDAGVDVDAAVGAACGYRGAATCPVGSFCSYVPGDLCGRADAAGHCLEIPTVCSDIYTPVCGCDGNTYANACSAAAASVGVDFEGRCPGAMGASCGGLAGARCASGFFCDEGSNCMIPDFGGSCNAIPTVCDRSLIPVCGCDGVTYSNACLAHMAGVSVYAGGACPVVASPF